MKKKYIRPTLDVVSSQLDEHLMDHSYGWVDAKGNQDWIGEEDEDGQIQNKNLWDD